MSAKKQKVGGAYELLQAQCLTVLRAVQRKKEAIFFLEPVDWKALDLPLYPKLIKKPMDLGTVERKLQESPCAYKAVVDFAADVNLVWHNAQTFNLEGSEIYEFAETCKQAFEAKMADVDGHGALRASASKSGDGPRKSLGGDDLAACKKVISELKRNKNAELFLAPVDWEALGLTDYPIVIKKPMDLGTIGKNLESGRYASAAAVASDVDQVWTNAMTYNVDGSFVYAAAEECKAIADQRMTSIVSAGRGAVEEAPQLTFEMLRQLNEDVARLTPVQLCGFLGIVKDACGRAVKDTPAGEVDIDLDILDLPAFLQVDKFVSECVGRRRLRHG